VGSKLAKYTRIADVRWKSEDAASAQHVKMSLVSKWVPPSIKQATQSQVAINKLGTQNTCACNEHASQVPSDKKPC
jgi:hypothetical protein